MGKSLRLTFKNSFKNAFASKSQLFGLITLIALLSLILSMISAISTRVLNQYETLKQSSNQHNVVMQLNPFEKVKTSPKTQLASEVGKPPTNIVDAQQYWLEEYNKTLDNGSQFNWSRTEAREFTQVFYKDGLITLKAIAKTTNNDNGSNEVDRLVISQGNKLSYNGLNQAVLDPGFAEANGIEIGSIIRLQKDNLGNRFLVTDNNNAGMTPEQKEDIAKIREEGLFKTDGLFLNSAYKNYNWLQVVGYGSSADFIMPILNANLPMPNRENQALVYVNPINFGLHKNTVTNKWEFKPNDAKLVVTSNNEWEAFYSIKAPANFGINAANTWFNINALGEEHNMRKLFYSINDKSYPFIKRTSTVETTILIYSLVATIVLILILVVSLYTMGLITKKQIEKARAQIGIMKALGYRKRDIILNFTILPFMTSVFGGILGYFIAQGIQVTIIAEIRNYFSMPLADWSFDAIGLGISILAMWMALTAIAFLIAYLILRKSALNLIQANKQPNVKKYIKFLKAVNHKKSISARMGNALFIDSIGKMFAVGGVVLLSTVLLTGGFASADILNRNRTKAFEGMNYNQLVEFQQPTYNNPFSFMKTFNKNAEVDFGKFENMKMEWTKNGSDKYTTVLKTGLDVTGDKEGGSYDVDKIIDKIKNNNLNSDYYSIALKTFKDGKVLPYPNADFITRANMRMLAANDIALSTNYFKYIASLATRPDKMDLFEGIIFSQLLAEWPSYINFKKHVDENQNNPKEFLKAMLNFYNFYSNSIGLTISNQYSTAVLPRNENDIPTDETRIKFFNSQTLETKHGWNNFKTQHVYGWDNITAKNLEKDMFVSDGKRTSDIGKNRIYFDQEKPTDDLLTLNVDKLDDGDPRINQYIAALELWFIIYFSNRSDTTILQATYSRAPYFVQQTLKEKYEKQEAFTTAFNLVSFDPQSEYLGTMFQAIAHNGLKFKVYGIKGDNPFMKLRSINGDNLNNKLSNPSPLHNPYGIVINQSLAKKLNLKEGSIIDQSSVLRETLRLQNNTELTMQNWRDGTDIKRRDADVAAGPIPKPGTGEIIPPEQGFVQTSLLDIAWNATAKVNGVKNPYELASIKPTPPLGIPTWNENSILNHYIQGGLTNNLEKFDLTPLKVVGIHDGYGQPTAWINNDDANSVMQYNDARDFLFDKYFKIQWGNDIATIIGNKIADLNMAPTTVEGFITENKKIGIDVTPIVEVFDNSHPIFNYKYSNDPGIADLDKLVSTNTMFGDYSPTAMNGDDKRDGIGRGSIAYVLPISTAKALLNQLSNVIFGIMLLLIMVIIAMTIIIITLTTSVIIRDNARFIATLKVLGYSNAYICKSILGMYMAMIASMLVVGFMTGFAIFYAIVQFISTTTTFVLPFAFVIWLPFAVVFIILVLYAITIGFGFRNITKLNATHLLQNQDL
ncbi:ABC transporter permease [Williamsoniiplasma lucivorax]|uniref:ABC transporter permease n=1 Tax=Williamsoniiplasma lucivorax TaxID=209274 RepID=A0A2S5RFK2_9MOLU|nr:ABC transporter permease [Williamsoniiplasma lucivorax]PPE06116.1 ABC transporter permease [Williamsoniiplasma lucivorax]